MVPLPEPRIAAHLPVLCFVGTSEYAGTVVNISRTGAYVRVEHYVPEIDARIRLFISGPAERQIEVDASVVRLTPHGFAARFLGTPVELLELLADLGG